MSWGWIVLLYVLLVYPFACLVGYWISSRNKVDRYWEYGWDDPESITEIAKRLRVPPPGKL